MPHQLLIALRMKGISRWHAPCSGSLAEFTQMNA